jgi:hypothetical protein
MGTDSPAAEPEPARRMRDEGKDRARRFHGDE